MINRLFILLIGFALISVNAKSQFYVDNYFDKTNLRGKIKSLKQTFFKDYLKKPGYWYNGHVSKPISTIPYTISYFNELGQLIKVCNDDSSEVSNLKYNQQGNLMLKIQYSPYNDTLKYKYEYNNLGHLTSEYIFQTNSKDTLIKDSDYKYDSQGHLIERIKYSYNYMNYGDLDKDRVLYEYDSIGRVSQSDYYIHDSIHVSLSTYVYDQNGKIIQEYSEFFLDDYQDKGVTTYKYDKYGNMSEELSISILDSSMSNVFTVDYEYDEKGNWILFVTPNLGGTPVKVTREIEYYK